MNKKRLLSSVMALVIIIIIAISGTLIYKNIVKPDKYKEAINLGNQYLSESNYEQSIIEFEKARNIYVNSIDARVGEAKAYIGINDVDTAVEKLKEAQSLDKNDEELLKETIDILTPVNKDIANEFLNTFVSNIGEGTLSEYVRGLVAKNESSDKTDKKVIINDKDSKKDEIKKKDESKSKEVSKKQNNNTKQQNNQKKEKKGDKVYTREEVKDYYWKKAKCDGIDTTIGVCDEDSDKIYNGEVCYFLTYYRKSGCGGDGRTIQYYVGSKTLSKYEISDVE